MKDEKRVLCVRGDDPDTRLLLAPTVGRYSEAPAPGSCLVPGGSAGYLRVVARPCRLVVPPDGGGIVREVLVRGRGAPVMYRQPLLRLSLSAEGLEAPRGEEAGLEAAGEERLPEGAVAVRSPTDGIFYRRPSPDAPPYVAEGETIERGRVLGLVEVMKCFNQVTWRGEAARAKVERVVPRDAGEVRLGQVLFVLRPL